jgi:hypothetical protein
MPDNKQITSGENQFKAATDEVLYSGETADVQLVRIVDVSGAEGSKAVIQAPFERAAIRSTLSQVFVATGNSAIVDESAVGRKDWSIQVSGVGAVPTSWTAALQVSNDNVNYRTLIEHTNADSGEGTIEFEYAAVALYYRLNVSALALGSATGLRVTVVAM